MGRGRTQRKRTDLKENVGKKKSGETTVGLYVMTGFIYSKI